MSKEATKKFIENNGFICNKCGKVIVDGIKHKNEEDLCDQCKIADLEAKLAEREENLALCEELRNVEENEYSKDIGKTNSALLRKCEQTSRLIEENKQLKQQLTEKDLRIEELESQFAYECECNKQFVDCQKENENLKQQLAEKEKETKQLKFDLGMFKSVNEFINRYGIEKAREVLLQTEKTKQQDKISFAVEQLEKAKEFLYRHDLIKDYQSCAGKYFFELYIDNQIEELRCNNEKLLCNSREEQKQI